MWFLDSSVQFSSVSQSCPTLCDPRDCSTPGLPIHHQIPEFTQTHVRRVGDAIQPSHPLLSPSPPTFNLSQHQESASFPMSQFFASGGQSIGVSASTSVLPMNIQDWFPLEWTGWISFQSKGLSRAFSNTQFKSINSPRLSFLYSPTLTSRHDYWKSHSFDKTDLCWQSNVSLFDMLSRLVITFLPRSERLLGQGNWEE